MTTSSTTPERRCRVIQSYTAEYPDPITFQAGETISVSDQVSTWNGNPAWRWLWCIDARGKGGWTPAAYFEAHSQTAIALRDYSAAELSATAGETLRILDAYGGWFWCANQSGQHGWIPQDHVEEAQPA
jgi:hypothetical protein